MTRVTDPHALATAVASGRTAVLFHATWCPHCCRYLPVFADEMRGDPRAAVEAVLDDDDNPLWAQYDIDVVPTVLLFEDGRVTARLDGRLGEGLAAGELSRALAG